jgi:hypothetical protein
VLRSLVLLVLLFLVPLSIAEMWLRENLWKYASYSNSAAIDRQLKEYEENGNWDLVFVGDSEVRWGVNPVAFDAELAKNGYRGFISFNHAFDGFGGPWWGAMIPRVFSASKTTRINHYLAVGIQMINGNVFWNTLSDVRNHGNCGALQKPVLISAFGIDLGLNEVCRTESSFPSWASNALAQPFWLFRYRSSLKSLLLPGVSKTRIPFNSAKMGEGFRGYEPHSPISARPEVFEDELARWKRQYDNEPNAFGPLPPEIWSGMTDYGGYFDRLADRIRVIGLEPIFFALPTNPLVIDFFRRREDYQKNSELLRQWARDRSVIFVDLGIQDRPDAEDYFSDVRHLSYLGANDFSRKLARSLAADSLFQAISSQMK